jgi:hypothetical protein
MLVLFVAPICLALMMVDATARVLGFYIAVRRWEAQRGIQLRFPPVTWARARQPQRGSTKRRGR